MQPDSHDPHDWESTDLDKDHSSSWESTDSEIESQPETSESYNVETSQVHFQVSRYKNEPKSEPNAVIIAGTGLTQKTFHMKLTLLFNASVLPRLLFADTALSTDLKLPTEDPSIVAMFIDWAKTPEEPIVYTPGQYSPEPWLSKAASAYFLGRRLGAALFSRYALSQFIQNCAIIARSPWKSIEDTAPAGSPLARFSNHWVAWNASIYGPGINEYSGLRAARTLHVNSNTRDPRVLDLDHWFASCGDDIEPECENDPVYMESLEEEDE